MRDKLTEYAQLMDQYLAMPTHNGFHLDNAERVALRRKEATAKEILKRLDPQLADFNIDS